MKPVKLYVGSSCINRTASGGWCAILIQDGQEKEIFGSSNGTTNNRMQLVAVIAALSELEEPCKVKLYSSNQYLCNSFTYGKPANRHLSATKWKPRGGIPFRKRNIKLSENIDLWNKLFSLCETHTVKASWVQDNHYIKRCSETAHSEAKALFDNKTGAKKSKEPEKKMRTVEIYTDGACIGNPGPGGWAAVLLYNGHEKEIFGGDAGTTNNRMGLSAVIEALSILKEPCKVNLYSDSKYVCNSLKLGWAKSWKANDWQRATGPALNPDLWDKLLSLCEIHKVNPIWVKGHSGIKYNERCDELATSAAWAALRA